MDASTCAHGPAIARSADGTEVCLHCGEYVTRPARGEVKARLASPGGWGTYGNSVDHQRYSQWITDGRRRRRRCYHGYDECPNRATHLGMANGVALTSGCEFHIAAWVKHGFGY